MWLVRVCYKRWGGSLRAGFGALDLVGLDWRLDYHIKSSVTGNDNEPVYYLTVKYGSFHMREAGVVVAKALVWRVAGRWTVMVGRRTSAWRARWRSCRTCGPRSRTRPSRWVGRGHGEGERMDGAGLTVWLVCGMAGRADTGGRAAGQLSRSSMRTIGRADERSRAVPSFQFPGIVGAAMMM